MDQDPGRKQYGLSGRSIELSLTTFICRGRMRAREASDRELEASEDST